MQWHTERLGIDPSTVSVTVCTSLFIQAKYQLDAPGNVLCTFGGEFSGFEVFFISQKQISGVSSAS
eukprot:976274-Amphidinium_carterae.1